MYVVLIQYCCWRQQYMINIVIIAVFIQRYKSIAWISYQKYVKFTYECRSNLSVLNIQSIWSFCYQKGN